MSVTQPAPAEAPPSTLVIDCDVHTVPKEGLKSILPYMDEAWRKRFERKRANFGADSLPLRYNHPNGRVIRADSMPPGGGPGGSDPEFLIADHLDARGVSAALLNTLQALGHSAILAGPDESVAMCAAFNDFHLQEWLPLDSRLRYAATVPVQDPLKAAEEVRRMAGHEGVAAVALPMMNTYLGNRWHYPIYEAAEEVGLPIALHVSGADYIYQGAPVAAGGIAESYAERFVTMAPTIGMTNLTNLVFTGTLERFPGLRFAFLEFGFGWVAPLLRRMDSAWRELRHETPWVTKPPSAYVHDQVRFTTQPSEEVGDKDDLVRAVGDLGADVLVFSSDYPHWDNDMPHNTLRGLEPETRKAILGQNAVDFFGRTRLGLAA
jgi:uncharacterized protein